MLMKKLCTVFAALACTFTALLPLRAEEANPAAMEAFKKDVIALETFTKSQEEALKDDPLAGITMIRNIVGRVKAVDTSKLPADLQAGWAEFSTALGKMGEVFKDWPEKPAEIQAFIAKKATDEPAFLNGFGEKMSTLEKEIQPAIAKMDALGKKYGFEGVGGLAPKSGQ